VRILKVLVGRTWEHGFKDRPVQEGKSGRAEARHLHRQGEELNAETPRSDGGRRRAWRIGNEATGIVLGGEARRVLRGAEWQPNMCDGSMILAICQILCLSYCIVIRTAGVDSNGRVGSGGIRRSCLGGDGVDTAVEMCGNQWVVSSG